LQIQFISQYFLAIFLRRCLGYSVVGQTSFDIEGSTLLKSAGSSGALNQGVGNEFAFSLGNGYSVSVADIGRILAIRSSVNPMVNSGLFRVTGIDTGNNWLFLDYRCSDTPPVESGLTFGLYADETVFNSVLNFTGNGLTGTYTGTGSATQSRIILQSPSSLNWQVRIAVENTYDAGFNSGGGVGPAAGAGGAGTSVAPGFGGNTSGDFQPGGQHLHSTLFFNKHTTTLTGATVGLFPAGSNQARVYIWGDDVTGSTFIATRTVVAGSDSFAHFGLPENDETPLPLKPAQRLFAMGANTPSNNGSNGIYMSTGTSTARGGAAFGLSNQPISCIYSYYTRLDAGLYDSGGIRNSSVASDNPYLNATELLTVDLVAGTMDVQAAIAGTDEIQILEGRRLGVAPLMRLGRGNYGYFQIATDASRSWLHLSDGIYMPWQGSILP
jgi:hypothetical protein